MNNENETNLLVMLKIALDIHKTFRPARQAPNAPNAAPNTVDLDKNVNDLMDWILSIIRRHAEISKAVFSAPPQQPTLGTPPLPLSFLTISYLFF